jgi:hypothetical protein
MVFNTDFLLQMRRSMIGIRKLLWTSCGTIAWLVVTSIAATAAADERSIDFIINPYHANIVDSWLFGINNQGQSTGYIVEHIVNSFTRSAITYQNGSTQVVGLGSSGGSFGLAGFAINNLGQVVGNVNDQAYFLGAGPAVPIEVPEKFVSLFVAGLLPGGLNDSGNALIGAYPNDPIITPTGAYSGLTLWNQAGAQQLTGLDPLYPFVNPPDVNDFNSGFSSGVYTASVTGLNNANQFAAGLHYSDYNPVDPNNFEDDVSNDFFTKAYIYDGQGGYNLLETIAPGAEIRPIDIDEVGTVFGWCGNQLALWGSNGALQLVLPDPATVLDDFGYNGFPTVQRNNLGQVVGVTVNGDVLFYDPISNAWTDITSSINGLGTGTFSTVQGFNDMGQFVGLARPPQGGGVFGYVVSSVPEPTSLAICGIGLAALLVARRRFGPFARS